MSYIEQEISAASYNVCQSALPHEAIAPAERCERSRPDDERAALMNTLQDGTHYREIASKLRAVARGCNFPNVRKDLIDLAARYDRRADHFDRPRGADDRLPEFAT